MVCYFKRRIAICSVLWPRSGIVPVVIVLVVLVLFWQLDVVCIPEFACCENGTHLLALVPFFTC